MRLDVGQQRVLEAFNELSDVPRPRQAGELSVQVRDLMAGQTGGTRLDDKRAAVDQAHNRAGPRVHLPRPMQGYVQDGTGFRQSQRAGFCCLMSATCLWTRLRPPVRAAKHHELWRTLQRGRVARDVSSAIARREKLRRMWS